MNLYFQPLGVPLGGEELLLHASNLRYFIGLATDAATIWFAFSVIRRRYDLDYPLSRSAHLIRWICVCAGFGAAMLRAPQFKSARIIGGLVSIAFLAWPNFAHHLSRCLRRRDHDLNDEEKDASKRNENE